MKTLLLVFALVLTGCATVPVERHNQSLIVLQRLDEFQNLVIDLYHTKQISPEHALVYSKFVVVSAKTIKEFPATWQLTVKAAWIELKKEIPLNQMGKLQTIANLVDLTIMELK